MHLADLNLIFYVIAYFLGSIPFGLIFAKLFAGIDIRESGSGNIGATNVLRVLKEKNPVLAGKLSFFTLLADALKASIPILVAKHIFNMPEASLWTIGVIAVIGHTFSIFLAFNGGKGVATGLGVTAVMLPIETLISFIIWIVVSKALKISSISSIIALITLYTTSLYISPETFHVPLGIIAFIIIYKHLPNIGKLLSGEEKRVI
jgi:glycerol-3-phosphate acyltransferase PlsY